MSFNFVEKVMCIGGSNIPPVFQFYKRGFVLGGDTPSYQDIVLSGVGALTLSNALADGLNYVKLFGDTELLPETYIDSVTAEGKCIQSNVPEGYTEYDSLIGDGTAYINLNCTLDQDDEIELEFTKSSNVASKDVFGARTAASSNNISVILAGSGNIVADFNNSDYNPYRLNQAISLNTRYKIVINKTGRYLYQGSTLVASNTTACPDTITTVGCYLFNLAGNGLGYKFVGTVHRCLIKGKRDVVPCGNGTTYGMYDKLNGVFYPNANTEGSFTVGSAVTTPTPSTPIDIWCNNGTIKVSPNLFDVANVQIQSETAITDTGALVSNVAVNFCLTYIPVKPSTTYTISGDALSGQGSTQGSVAYFRLAEYDSSQQFIVRSEGVEGSSYTFTTGATTYYIRFHYTITADLNTYQLELGSTATTYMPYGQIYTKGTVETVTDSNGLTASCQRLLSVGDYKDTQEILAGAVTRNVGIKVLNGTETCVRESLDGNIFYRITTDVNHVKNTAGVMTIGYCTHCKPVINSATALVDGTFVLGVTTTQILIGKTGFSTATEFQQWLADQYANGTPVIVLYPLTTATTESVTGQVLTKSPVTYSGSISGLTGTLVESSHTTPTPTNPLDINCNNGVLKVSKNLFDISELNISTVPNDNVSYKVYSVPNGTYTMSSSNFPYSATCNIFFIAGSASSGASSATNGVAQYKPITITVSDGYYTVGYRSGQTNPNNPKDYNWQIELGSTATTYRPYGSTYTDGTVEMIGMRAGNLVDNTIEAANISMSGEIVSASSAFITHTAPVIPGETYTCNGLATLAYYTSKPNIGSVSYNNNRIVTTNTTFTVPNDPTIKYVAFRNAKADSWVVKGTSLYNGGTATAEMLLKVGTYQDIHSVLNGQVTRNVGVKVLDGTEGWGLATAWGTHAFSLPRFDGGSGIVPLICSHNINYAGSSITSLNQQCTMRGSSFILSNNNYTNTSATDFKSWLASQYNAGAPVIVVYPLATATTESVTAQPLTIQEGTNIVEITQASIDNLPLEVSYKATV